jgi:hypothetical protein
MHLAEGLQFSEHLIDLAFQALQLLFDASGTASAVGAAIAFRTTAAHRRTKSAAGCTGRRSFAKSASRATCATITAARWRSILRAAIGLTSLSIAARLVAIGLVSPCFFAPCILAARFLATRLTLASALFAALLHDELECLTAPHRPQQTARRWRLCSGQIGREECCQQSAHCHQSHVESFHSSPAFPLPIETAGFPQGFSALAPLSSARAIWHALAERSARSTERQAVVPRCDQCDFPTVSNSQRFGAVTASQRPSISDVRHCQDRLYNHPAPPLVSLACALLLAVTIHGGSHRHGRLIAASIPSSLTKESAMAQLAASAIRWLFSEVLVIGLIVMGLIWLSGLRA